MLRFWRWWSTRADALQEHFKRRRKGNVFTKWKNMWCEIKLMHDSEELADMHYEHFAMRKAFLGWEDIFITNKLESQLLRGALLWGRRRIVERTWNAWKDCSLGLFDDKYNM